MSTSPSTTNPTTLVGFLGKDRIERFTPERTYTIEVPDPILDGDLVEKEVTAPGRPYLKLSLASHEGGTTCWHDCIVWGPEHRTGVQSAYMARKGDRVELSGRFEDYEFKVDGKTIAGRHFVVEEFHFLRLKSPKID
jgi:single-stranded DNA-binding protein